VTEESTVKARPINRVASTPGRRPPVLRGASLLMALVCLAASGAESACRGQMLAAENRPDANLMTVPFSIERTWDNPPPNGDDAVVLEIMPFSVLWEPPLANQREPRCYAKFINPHGQGTIDTAIGADFSLGRIGPASHKDEGFEIDVFGVVFTRFGQRRELAAADYRFGFPLTLAKDGWQFKLGYEHTSTHVGDDVVKDWITTQGLYSGLMTPDKKFVRDEIVFGIARRLKERFRLYGQLGSSFANNGEIVNDVWRFDWGLEWTPPRSAQRQGGPYAAFDMDLRDEQRFFPNVTVQAGWLWRVRPGRSSAARLAAEFYHGKSPFGRFLEESETWCGFVASYDW
jgi:hypothetical protein